jgi:hypothetical protein
LRLPPETKFEDEDDEDDDEDDEDDEDDDQDEWGRPPAKKAISGG